MTFEEAVQRKIDNPGDNGGDTVFTAGEHMKIMIVPLDQNDFNRYALDYYEDITTDEHAKNFSTNNQYQVMALKYNATRTFLGLHPW